MDQIRCDSAVSKGAPLPVLSAGASPGPGSHRSLRVRLRTVPGNGYWCDRCCDLSVHVPTHWEKPSFQNIKFCLALLVIGPKSLHLALWAGDLVFLFFGNQALHHRFQRRGVSFQREDEAQGKSDLLSTFLHPNIFEKSAPLAEQICSWCPALFTLWPLPAGEGNPRCMDI